MIIVDIETVSQSDEQLEKVMPHFKAPKNYKDKDKIAAAICEIEMEWRDRAALSPLTGQILAIGMLSTTHQKGEQDLILHGDEADMLRKIWVLWDLGSRFVGFNVKEFDFRYMEIRSRILSVPVPNDLHEGRYWNRRIVCLQELFTCYSRDTSGFSLDAICKACGLPGKLPGVTGADFARLFTEDRDKAMAYLKADLNATAALAARLGVS